MRMAALLRLISRAGLVLAIAGVLGSPLIGAPTSARATTTITVNVSADLPDYNGTDCTCAVGSVGKACSLRAAIQTANVCPGADTIVFSLPFSISPASALPALSDYGGGTTISGAGQGVIISGTSAGNVDGLTLYSDGNKVQGLTITGFSGHNVAVYGSHNVIGVDGDGLQDDSERNVIIDAGHYGVHVAGNNNTLAGNYIGVAANGTDKAQNGFGGVYVELGSGNVIGTNADGVSDVLERNVIAGSSPTGTAVNVATTSSPGGTRIAGNYIGTTADGDAALPDQFLGVYVGYDVLGTVVGTDGDGQGDALEGNVISGIAIPGAGGAIKLRSTTVVAGNYIGLNAAGTAVLPNYYGVLMDVANDSRIGTNADGVSDALERNVVAGSVHTGLALMVNGPCAVVVAGNYVGTNALGTGALPNTAGLRVSGANHWRIGGYTAAEGNVVSGNGSGIVAYGGGTGTEVVGNYIGVAPDGVTALPNTLYGVWLRGGATGIQFGSPLPGGGNVIANSGVAGIYTDTDGDIQGNTFRANSIYGNGGLGIDLQSGGAGVTANDTGDADVGPNGLQNYPVLGGVLTAADASSSLISGTLNSTALASFTLDFYANDVCDASDYGEGGEYLGSVTTTTNAVGDASFALAMLESVPVGTPVTAVATDAFGSSSEFSACVSASAPAAGAPSGVTLSGPATGFIGLPYTFRATVQATASAFPLTITWYADGVAQSTRTLSSAGDTQALTWSTSGSRTVAATVHNASGSVSGGLAFTARGVGDNVAPQAEDGAATCVAGGSTGGTLAATDADGDVLTYSLVSNGSRGVATITDASTGAYTYAATAGVAGSDSFTFRAHDGVAHSGTATVVVTIAPTGPEYAMTFVPLAVARR